MKKLYYIFIVCLLSTISIIVLNTTSNYKFTYNKQSLDNGLSSNGEKNNIEEKKNEKSEIKILATGDIIFHQPLYKHNVDENGNYIFDDFYAYMKEYFDNANLVVGNFEGTIDPNSAPRGFPMFNAPVESAKCLKDAGFGVLSTSNNHCLDSKENGIITTIDALNNAGIKTFGTGKDKNYVPLIVNVNGIRIGFISYSERFNGMDVILNEDDEVYVSRLDTNNIDRDIDYLNSQNVDFVIAYPHYGEEYASKASPSQMFFSDYLKEKGVGAVLGSHPHVLQQSFRENINGKEVFTIYSMGNSLSNQRQVYTNKELVEFGIFIELDIEKSDEETILKDVRLIPTYTHRFREDGMVKTRVFALSDVVDSGKYRDLLDNSAKSLVDSKFNKINNRLAGIE